MSSPNLSPSSSILSNAATTALSLGNLALVIPNISNGFSQTKGYQPQNKPNQDGTPSSAPPAKSFLFDYEGEQSAELMSDITDHFVETNVAIQDQIALRPTKLMTKGFISELNDIVPAFLQPLKTIANSLTAINSYAPGLSQTAILAYNEAFFAYQTAISLANSAVSAWSTVSGGGTEVFFGGELAVNNFPLVSTQTKQQIAFQTFYGYWITRTLFTIQTPWAVFANMAIERLHPIQTEDTQTITNFECTFKQIRTVQSSISPSQSTISTGRLSTQSQALNSQGVSTPTSDISLITGLSGTTSSPFGNILN